jgi:catechol 2,3-dioxygenase-like lactoylglutathione lyase family enzyme
MPDQPRQHIGAITLVVRDYDEAKACYTGRLGFTVVKDTDLGNGKRWLLVAPPGSSETRLLLARAATPVQESRIGDQAGGRVFLFLHTDDFWRDFRALQARGVTFLEAPRQEPYGTVAVFEDLYGNRWDLLQPTTP